MEKIKLLKIAESVLEQVEWKMKTLRRCCIVKHVFASI